MWVLHIKNLKAVKSREFLSGLAVSSFHCGLGSILGWGLRSHKQRSVAEKKKIPLKENVVFEYPGNFRSAI